jgi:hypothetical protein
MDLAEAMMIKPGLEAAIVPFMRRYFPAELKQSERDSRKCLRPTSGLKTCL